MKALKLFLKVVFKNFVLKAPFQIDSLECIDFLPISSKQPNIFR